MKLSLYSEDLKPEHQNLTARAVRFEHLSDEAQAAVILVGRGVFYECDRWNSYNVVNPPKPRVDWSKVPERMSPNEIQRSIHWD